MLKIISESEWIKFINQSENPTIYHHPVYLKVFEEKIDFNCFFKGEQLILGIPLIKKRSERLRFQAYNGFLYLERKKTKKQKIISSNFKGLEEFADYFHNNYDDVTISCDDTQTDVRPFIWHNYPKTNFFTEEYYTSKILLKNFSRELISESRRQEIQKSEKLGLIIKETDDYKSAANFLYGTVNEKNSFDDEKICLNIMKSLSKEKMGKLFSCSIKDKIISYAYFGIINNKVFYMFAGADKNFKEIPYHALIIYKSLIFFKKKYSEFDFVGVNSPSKGSFKLSFGGNLNRCLKLKMKKNKN